MPSIKLNQGYTAVVDDQDYDMVIKHKWFVTDVNRSVQYARTIIVGKTVLMHRLIMGLVDTPEIIVDHRNRCGLDNRRENLRICSHSENAANTRSKSGSKSGYKGIHPYGNTGGWRAAVSKEGKKVWSGVFDTEFEAALAYDAVARKVFGEFANLNFPFLQAEHVDTEVGIKRSRYTSRFRGVSWKSKIKKWVAQISVGGRKIHLGCFDCEEEAAKVYDEVARKSNLGLCKINIKENEDAERILSQ